MRLLAFIPETMKRPGKTKKFPASKVLNNNKHQSHPNGSLCNGNHGNHHEIGQNNDVKKTMTDSNGKVPNGNVFHEKYDKNSQYGKPNRNTSECIYIFPLWLPWVITLVTLIFRVHYVLQPINWWILHPDEVFQTTEGTFTPSPQASVMTRTV